MGRPPARVCKLVSGLVIRPGAAMAFQHFAGEQLVEPLRRLVVWGAGTFSRKAFGDLLKQVLPLSLFRSVVKWQDVTQPGGTKFRRFDVYIRGDTHDFLEAIRCYRKLRLFARVYRNYHDRGGRCRPVPPMPKVRPEVNGLMTLNINGISGRDRSGFTT
ncbi:hypothetical protein O6H91_Y514500 [Diphasiastrum complanatum]|nr:hypothetical protein O6H91_Y514500 [Diphasiastrum complanatum]